MHDSRRTLTDPAAPLRVFGAIATLAFTVLHATIRWEWLLMMDEPAYLERMPKVTSVFHAFLSDFAAYWHHGRLHPVKYFTNLARWCWLPLDTQLFHWINFAILALSAAAGAWALTERRGSGTDPGDALRARAKWLLFGAGLLICQRPVLDVAALTTIPEGFVILFLGLGLCLFPQRSVGYRLFFLLCAFSKEIAGVVFLASAIAQLARGKRREGALDLALFLGISALMWQAKNAGDYAREYTLVDSLVLRQFALASVKVAIGLLPPIALIAAAHQRARGWAHLTERLLSPRILACLVFGCAYLYLAAARNPAGYLLLPAGFALSLATFGVIAADPPSPRSLSRPRSLGLAFLFLAVMASSLFRYEAYARAMNGPSAAFRGLIRASSPRLILINGSEAATHGEALAEKASPNVRVLQTDPVPLDQVKGFAGDIIVLELSGYFGKIPSDTLESLRSAVGGWKRIKDFGAYRVFEGRK